jgi:hypothetical protein
LDGTFLNGKFEVVFDWWKKNTKDLLFSLPIPDVIGTLVSAPALNIAEMTNKGIDLQLINRGKIASDWGYEANLTWSYLKNEIVSLAPGVKDFPTGDSRIGNLILNAQGQALSSFYGYQVAGLFQSQADVDASPKQENAAPGRFKFVDQNKDGKINADDRTILGNPIPKFNGGLNLKVTYKNFEVATFLYGVFGNKIYNFSKWYTDFYPSFTGAAIGKRVKDSWTFDKGGNSVPIFENVSNFSTNTQSNSYYVEKGDYVRMTNLSLAYKVPTGFLNKFGFDRARFYVQATNLFTLTKYKGLDPGVGGSADTNFGIDVGNYPVTRGYNLGVSLGF